MARPEGVLTPTLHLAVEPVGIQPQDVTARKGPTEGEMDTVPMKRFDVVGLGVSTLDFFMVVDDFPGDERVQPAEHSFLQGGGPIATALVTLARLGARTAMLDTLGDDWRGLLILEEFEREAVSTEYLAVTKARTSSIALILVRKADGARTIVYSPGDAGEMTATEVPETVISASKIVHLNGRHPQACMALATLAKEHGVRVSFDGGAHRFRPELRDIIPLTDICIVARQFAFAFSSDQDLDRSAAKLLDAGPKIVVITAGEEGSWIYDREGGNFHQPAFDVGPAVDTTGAGDAYHGAFLYGIINDYPLRRCAELASAVAAMNTRQLGGRSALPSLPEAQQFLSERGGTAFVSR